MKRKSLEHTQTTTTTTTVQAHEDYDGGLTELQKSIIREQQQQQQHEVPPWYVEEEQMFLQQEDAYFENQRRLENSRPKLAVIICDDNEVNLKILTRLFSKVFFREVKVIQCRDPALDQLIRLSKEVVIKPFLLKSSESFLNSSGT